MSSAHHEARTIGPGSSPAGDGARPSDRPSARTIWEQHRRWVGAILLAHKPAWADVEDLLQDVALSVARRASDLRDPNAVRPWLRTIAINTAHAAARSGKRAAKMLSLQDGGDAPPLASQPRRAETQTPDAISEATEQGGSIVRLAMQLPDGYREPLLLKAVQGMSYREIGRVLGLPETTIETRVARGRRMLRELVEEQESGGSQPLMQPSLQPPGQPSPRATNDAAPTRAGLQE